MSLASNMAENKSADTEIKNGSSGPSAESLPENKDPTSPSKLSFFKKLGNKISHDKGIRDKSPGLETKKPTTTTTTENNSGPTLETSNIPPISTTSPTPTTKKPKPLASTSPITSINTSGAGLPSPPAHSIKSASSPIRTYTSSPRLSSASSSQIFERNVQDPSAPAPASPSIPAHFQTENHIPPVLEASSLAITDSNVDPDDVEVVSVDHPAPPALTVGASSPTTTVLPQTDFPNPWHEEAGGPNPHATALGDLAGVSDALTGSNIPIDKRRLSFISFADMVHVEQAEGSDHPPTNPTSPITSTAVPTSPNPRRSPSPIRSPIPRAMTPSQEHSLLGSSPPPHDTLTVETMGQALRKHGSGADLTSSFHAHKAPLSPPLVPKETPAVPDGEKEMAKEEGKGQI